MKTITLDFDTYKAELLRAKQDGSFLYKELLKAVEKHLQIISELHSINKDKFYESERYLSDLVIKLNKVETK